MKLYYASGGCSITPHLVLEKMGKPFDCEHVNIREGGTRAEGFLQINPKGKTPVLALDDGTVITENPIICQYLADTNPETELLPADLKTRFEALQISAYFCDTVHNYGLTRLFRPGFFCGGEIYWDGIRKEGEQVVTKAFGLIAPRLENSTFLFDSFSITDAAVFYSEMHASRLKIAMPPSVRAHFEMMLSLPETQRVLAREELDMTDYLPA